MLHTPLCDLLGIQHPIIATPLGPDISTPELVAAVSNAGGFGFLRAPDGDNPDTVRKLVRRTRELTSRPFGVGVVLAFPYGRTVDTLVEENVAVIQLFWGDYPKELVEKIQSRGVKVIHQVGSVEDARKAAAAGVDAIQVQGYESGGHVMGEVSTMALVPAVVDCVAPIPVIASGGIADSRGVVAALALGAQGVALGTRFLVTQEANAHPEYKKMIAAAGAGDTVHTLLFGRARWPDAPMRTLRTPLVEAWHGKVGEAGDELAPSQPLIGHSTIYGQEKDVKRFAGTAPNASTTGDIPSFALYAGEVAGLIHDVPPAAEVVNALVEGARAIIEQRLQGYLAAPKTTLQTMV